MPFNPHSNPVILVLLLPVYRWEKLRLPELGHFPRIIYLVWWSQDSNLHLTPCTSSFHPSHHNRGSKPQVFSAGHRCQCTISMNSFNLPKSLQDEHYYPFLPVRKLNQWGNWSTERLSNLPEITQLGREGLVRPRARLSRTLSMHLLPFIHCYFSNFSYLKITEVAVPTVAQMG